jgi:hypothetical protein
MIRRRLCRSFFSELKGYENQRFQAKGCVSKARSSLRGLRGRRGVRPPLGRTITESDTVLRQTEQARDTSAVSAELHMCMWPSSCSKQNTLDSRRWDSWTAQPVSERL